MPLTEPRWNQSLILTMRYEIKQLQAIFSVRYKIDQLQHILPVKKMIVFCSDSWHQNSVFWLGF